MAKFEKCPTCGGYNTADAPCDSSTEASAFGFTPLIIGLGGMLLQTFFVPGKRICQDCGRNYSYRKQNAFIALVLFLLLSLLVGLSAEKF